jgi:hypothetical protein
MPLSKPELELRRREVLAQFRAARGSHREPPKNISSRREIMSEYLKPFLRTREGENVEGSPAKPGEAEIEAFCDAVKGEPRQTTLAGTEGGQTGGRGANWEELLEGTGLRQFRESALGWLGSAPLELGLSSTPLPELKRLRAEAHCRQRVLGEMLKVADREIDELDIHIRALQDLNT